MPREAMQEALERTEADRFRPVLGPGRIATMIHVVHRVGRPERSRVSLGEPPGRATTKLIEHHGHLRQPSPGIDRRPDHGGDEEHREKPPDGPFGKGQPSSQRREGDERDGPEPPIQPVLTLPLLEGRNPPTRIYPRRDAAGLESCPHLGQIGDSASETPRSSDHETEDRGHRSRIEDRPDQSNENRLVTGHHDHTDSEPQGACDHEQNHEESRQRQRTKTRHQETPSVVLQASLARRPQPNQS
jgi:hypothetical protein